LPGFKCKLGEIFRPVLTRLLVTERPSRLLQGIIALLGVFSLSVILAFHNITDGDLWAKLAIGETVWKTGHILHHDVYAFTPTLPEYIDHEMRGRCGLL